MASKTGETLDVRVLVEQQAHEGREYLASGVVVTLPSSEARDLLSRGEAEVVASKPASRAEKRPVQRNAESRA